MFNKRKVSDSYRSCDVKFWRWFSTSTSFSEESHLFTRRKAVRATKKKRKKLNPELAALKLYLWVKTTKVGCWRKKYIHKIERQQLNGRAKKRKKTEKTAQQKQSRRSQFELRLQPDRLNLCARRDSIREYASDRQAFDCVLSWCSSLEENFSYFLSIN